MEAMQDTRKIFCTELTREAGDPLLGTATDITTWLLLEYNLPWHTKATADNELPPAVQSCLDQQLAAIPGSRLIFIKQARPSDEGLRFFVARTDESKPKLYRFDLAAYEEITALELAAVATGEGMFAGKVISEPLHLVCTNGKRDKCCAKYGLPMFQAIAAAAPETTWQSTHMGGHRYAPNVMFLPHSVNYGLMSPDEAQPAVAAHARGEIYDLNRYRGRTYYAPPVAAADTFLRRELGLMGLADLRLESAQQQSEERWRVQFSVAPSGDQHAITLASEFTAAPQLISCSNPVMEPVARFRLLAHEPA